MDKEGHEPCVLAAGKSAIEDVAGNLLGQVTADEPVESNNNNTNVTYCLESDSGAKWD